MVGPRRIAHLNQPPPDPRSVVPGIAPHAAHAVLKALEQDPDRHFVTAGEFSAALV